ncbi:MAG: DUF1638 domain-containing protein [Cephaloticoccus sp.]|nr:DUF1638 domain-containing protein [Cephaloticoccus sp.]MCF7760924.1 DUF1638 domain-containing protein [Cephaloticoccus sp.]
MAKTSNLTVIACGVLEPEIRHFTQHATHIVETVFLPLGLHENPARLQMELQSVIDRAEANPVVETIVLVYGLCGRGVENLRHDRCPLVIARAHDCVTLFLGDKDRFARYQAENPGAYWYNPGWIRGKASPGPEREAHLRKEYAEKFGEDDVEYLLEVDRGSLSHYTRATYVGLGLGEPEKEVEYTKTCAACMGWGFDRIPGDPALLQALLTGDWDEKRFLIVPPHHVIRLTGDESIIRAEPEGETK